MSGGKLISKILKEYDVDTIFTLCGGHISPILVESEKLGIKIVDTRQEETAAFAADAYSRVSGKIGVAAVTAGPGISNTITALKNAQMSYSPMILIGGATATILKGKGSLQDIDQISLVKPHVKYIAKIQYSFQIPILFKKAFDKAVNGLPGPVFIELPVDLLYEEDTVREWYLKDIEKGVDSLFIDDLKKVISNSIYQKKLDSKMFNNIIKSTQKRGMKNFLSTYLDIQFLGSSYLKPLKLNNDSKKLDFDENEITKICQLLESSTNPLFIIGPQINYDLCKIDEVVTLLNKVKVPVYLTGGARGLLGDNCDFQFFHSRSKAIKKSDLVLLLGIPMDFRLNYGMIFSKKTKIVSINLSAKDIGLNKKPHYQFLGKPADFLLRFLKDINTKKVNENIKSWKKFLKNLNFERDNEISVKSKAKSKLVNPLKCFMVLKKYLTKNSLLVLDGGDFVGTGSYVIRPTKPLSWLDPGPFGTLGVGGGFTLGAFFGELCKSKLKKYNDVIWLIYGDGASGYSLIEFETFVKFKIPVVGIIGNDASWAQIAREQVPLLGRDTATNLPRTNYHLLAEALGAKGILVKKNNQLSETFKEASKIARSGLPVLINVHLDKSNFREGSISI